jgi:cytochrome c oxidase assembly protein subunit 15
MTQRTPASASETRRRIAWLCALLVLAIAAVSAYLRLSKVGLGCEPWPSCYGQELRAAQRGEPPDATAMQALAVARLAHRILASTALVLVLMLAFAALTAKPARRGEVPLALALLATALFLAALGWFTRGSQLPAVALGNLLGGFAMLALAWRLAAREPADPRRPSHASAGAPRAGWAALALAALAMQVALGGLLSAGHATFSCADVAACVQQASLDGWRWELLDPWREPRFDAAASLPANPQGALVNLLHRAGSIVVVLTVLAAAAWAWRAGQRWAVTVLLVTLALQFALGLWLAGAGATVAAALVHNLVAALMVAVLVRLV